MRRILATLVFLVLAGSASSLWAQDRSIGLGIGYVKPSNVDGTLWFTANAHFKLAERVVLEPELGYWTKTMSFAPILDISISDFNLGANVLYRPPSHNSSVRFSVGAGLGLHFLSGKAGVLGFTASDSATKLGVHLLAGATFGSSPSLRYFADARYDFVSDLNQFKIYGGVRFKL
ncbi:MAG TPA: outer membrane beta-barrel protein [Vicinamibacteria bacterium]|nr:outer membrane beta-barrel protein [Vicinamibacteria bacterium]